jgi:hypothetical protein
MDYLNSLIYDRPAYTESVQPTVDKKSEKQVDDKKSEKQVDDKKSEKQVEDKKSEKRIEDKKPDDIVLEQPEQVKQEVKHEDIKVESDDEFMKKMQSGEYVNELRDVRGSRNSVKRAPLKTQERLQPANNSHIKQTDTKSLDIKTTKIESDDIDVVKDKIKDATNDKNVFFSTMFNK